MVLWVTLNASNGVQVMAAATFDTLKFVQIPDADAAPLANITLVRKDIQAMELHLRADPALRKWMTGLMSAGVFSLILTSFF